MRTTRLYTLLGHMDMIQGESEQLAPVLAECSYTCIIHLNDHRVGVCAHENFNAESKILTYIHADFDVDFSRRFFKSQPNGAWSESAPNPHPVRIKLF